MSSIIWGEAPSSPSDTPPCEAPTRPLGSVLASIGRTLLEQGRGLLVELGHQLLEGLGRLLGGRRLAVEAEPVLHRRDSLALLGLGHDRARLSKRAAAFQRLNHLLHVVS